MQFKISKIFILLLISCFAFCCASNYIIDDVPQYDPIIVNTDKYATISFKRVLFQIPPGTKIGEKDPHNFMPGKELYWKKSITVGDEIFNEIVNDELLNAGYNVIGADIKLFDSDTTWKANYLLGAKIIDIKYYTYSDWAERAESSLAVRWEIFDKSKRNVIYKTTTFGVGKTEGSEGLECLYIAFRNATRNLLANSQFIDTLFIGRLDSSLNNNLKNILLIEGTALPVFQTKTQLIKRVIESVVTIRTENRKGSGFIISENGYSLTSAHVIKGMNIIDVIFSNGLTLQAEVVQTAIDYDLALLKLRGSGFKPLPLGNTNEYLIGTEVYAVGTPAILDLAQSVTKGIISGARVINEKEFLQTDVPVNPGNSGGPLIAINGDVLGIVTWKIKKPEHEGLSFCIPINIALEKLGIKVNH